MQGFGNEDCMPLKTSQAASREAKLKAYEIKINKVNGYKPKSWMASHFFGVGLVYC